jgi:hypothetical protein
MESELHSNIEEELRKREKERGKDMKQNEL